MKNILTAYSEIHKSAQDGSLTVKNESDNFLCIERIWGEPERSLKIKKYTDQKGVDIDATKIIPIRINEATQLIIPPKKEIEFKVTGAGEFQFVYTGYYYCNSENTKQEKNPFRKSYDPNGEKVFTLINSDSNFLYIEQIYNKAGASLPTELQIPSLNLFLPLNTKISFVIKPKEELVFRSTNPDEIYTFCGYVK